MSDKPAAASSPIGPKNKPAKNQFLRLYPFPRATLEANAPQGIQTNK